MTVTIRLFQPDDFQAWTILWTEYDGKESDHIRLTTIFNQLLDPSTPSEGLVAVKDGQPVGFAHIVYHPSSMQGKNVAFLEDLGVLAAFRGQKIGKSLIDYGVSRAREKDCARFFWLTDPGNENAQRLYNHYAEPQTKIRYVIPL